MFDLLCENQLIQLKLLKKYHCFENSADSANFWKKNQLRTGPCCILGCLDRYPQDATFSFYSFFSFSVGKSSKMAEMCQKMVKIQLCQLITVIAPLNVVRSVRKLVRLLWRYQGCTKKKLSIMMNITFYCMRGDFFSNFMNHLIDYYCCMIGNINLYTIK